MAREIRIVPRARVAPAGLGLTVWCLLAASGCAGSSTGPTVPAEPSLAERETAPIPEGLEPPPPPPPPPAAPADVPERPTFAQHIAPLVHARCAVCHHTGGSAPFPLTTWDEVKDRARQIARVTASRYMPPWPPAPGYGTFRGERRLSEREIATIARWVETGAPAGDLAEAPAPPHFERGWELGPPDLEIRLPEPITLRAEGLDEFLNLVVPDVVSETRFVRAVDFDPVNPRIVHHAEFRIDETDESLARDLAEDGPGYHGMDADTAHYPPGFFVNWVPGKSAAFYPDEMSWRLEAGTDVVMQLHMVPSGKPERIDPVLALYFTDRPPRVVAPYNVRLGTKSIDIPPGVSDYTVVDTYRLPIEVALMSILAHAHYIGRRIEAWATHPDGSKRWLLMIPDWDFNWQDEYVYADPPVLPAGTIVTMRYVYDNSAANERNPHDPPIRVRYGPKSSDEMGDLYLQVLPRGALDRQLLIAHHGRHSQLKQAALYEAALRTEPAAWRHRKAARAYERAGYPDEALAHLRAAVALDPDEPSLRTLLAAALQRAGRLDEALAELRRAVELAPDDAIHHFNLAAALTQAGRRAEAIAALDTALERDPSLARAHRLRADLITRGGREESDPSVADAAIRHYDAVLAVAPDDPAALAGLARLLAVHPDAARRDPGRALSLAERVVAKTRGHDPRALRALAAARAAHGDWSGAVEACRRAIARVGRRGDPELARALGRELDRYRERAGS